MTLCGLGLKVVQALSGWKQGFPSEAGGRAGSPFSP